MPANEKERPVDGLKFEKKVEELPYDAWSGEEEDETQRRKDPLRKQGKRIDLPEEE